MSKITFKQIRDEQNNKMDSKRYRTEVKPVKGFKLRLLDAYEKGGLASVLEVLDDYKDPKTGKCLYPEEIIENLIKEKYPAFRLNPKINLESKQTGSKGGEQEKNNSNERDDR